MANLRRPRPGSEESNAQGGRNAEAGPAERREREIPGKGTGKRDALSPASGARATGGVMPAAGAAAVEDAESGDQDDLWRLAASFADRDTEISALNRGLGALDQRLRQLEDNGRPSENEDQGWFERFLRAVGLRKGADIETGGLTRDGTRRVMPLIPFGQERERVIAVTAFGLSREKLESVLDTVEKYCRKKATLPVVLTDSDCFEAFRERDMAFEYLPPAQSRDQFAPDLEWPLYFQRRLTLFRRKWRPVGIISFGTRTPVEGLEELLTTETPDAPRKA